MLLLCLDHAFAMLFARLWLCFCYDFAMLLLHLCYAFPMLFLCHCHPARRLSHCHPARRLSHGLLALDPGCPSSEEGPLPYPRGRRTRKPREVLRSRRGTASRGRALSPPQGGRARPRFQMSDLFQDSGRDRPSHVGGDVGVGPPKPYFSGIRPRFLRLLQRWEDAD